MCEFKKDFKKSVEMKNNFKKTQKEFKVIQEVLKVERVVADSEEHKKDFKKVEVFKGEFKNKVEKFD